MKFIKYLLLAATLIFFTACFNSEEETEKEISYNFLGMSMVDTTMYLHLHKQVYYDYNTNDTLVFIKSSGLSSTDTVRYSGLSFTPSVSSHYPLADGGHVFYGRSGVEEEYYYYNELWEIGPDGNTRWLTTPEELVNSFTPVDGGYLMIGNEYIYDDTTNRYDGYVALFDETGNLVSEDTLDAGRYDRYEKILPAPDGGYFTVGSNMDPDTYYDDIFGAKFTSDWEFEWGVQIGGDRWDSAKDGLILADGSYLMIGSISLYDSTFQNYGLNSGSQIYAANIATDSTLLWKTTLGNSLDEMYTSSLALSDGGCLIMGYRDQNYDYLFDTVTGWIRRLSASGEELWALQTSNELPYQAFEMSDGILRIAYEKILDIPFSYRDYTVEVHVKDISLTGTVLDDVAYTP